MVNLVGSMASKAVVRTLLSVFAQCRAFYEPVRERGEVMNMVSDQLLAICSASADISAGGTVHREWSCRGADMCYIPRYLTHAFR